jgi:hypothetical protein
VRQQGPKKARDLTTRAPAVGDFTPDGAGLPSILEENWFKSWQLEASASLGKARKYLPTKDFVRTPKKEVYLDLTALPDGNFERAISSTGCWAGPKNPAGTVLW